MRPSSSLSREEKLRLIAQISESDERFTADYSALLEGFLQDPSEEVRAAAVQALWDYPEPRLTARLIEVATRDEALDVRVAALLTLGRAVYEGDLSDEPESDDERWDEIHAPDRTSGDRALNFLLATFADEGRSPAERRQALESLAFSHAPEVLSAIEQAHESSDADMRVSAIFAMGRNGAAQWEPIVLAALQSSHPDIRTEAARAAGEMALAAAAPTLAQWARRKETPRQVRLWAIFALGQTGAADAAPLLERLTRDRDAEIADTARAALDEWELMQGIGHLDDFDDDDIDLDERLWP